jgi:hypothetical protein
MSIDITKINIRDELIVGGASITGATFNSMAKIEETTTLPSTPDNKTFYVNTVSTIVDTLSWRYSVNGPGVLGNGTNFTSVI